MYKRLKRYFFDLLDKGEQNGIAEKVFDVFIIALILLNSIAVIIESSIRSPNFLRFLSIFEMVSVIIFTIEYLLRLWVSDLYFPKEPRWNARLKYVFSGMAIIDILAILPFYVPFLIPVDLRVLRMLRLFRLIRLFKANRYTNGLRAVISVLKNKKGELGSSVIVILTLIIMSSAVMYGVENRAQPEVFRSVLDSMWWATSTFTTVGYGDIYPITGFGKSIAGIISILGIGLVAIPTGIIASGFTELTHQKPKDQNICPTCGQQMPVDHREQEVAEDNEN